MTGIPDGTSETRWLEPAPEDSGPSLPDADAEDLDLLMAEIRDRLARTVTTPRNLHSLLQAVLSVGSDLELDSVLQRIVSSATSLLDARYGALGVRSEDGGLSEFVYVGIHPSERERMGHLPAGRGILGLLINDPRTVRLRELSQHPASIGFPPNHPPMGSFLGTPIMVRGTVFGSIYLTEKLGADEFTEEDAALLRVLATSAGIAIDNARLFEQSRNRERWLSALAAITTRVLVGDSVDDVLGRLVDEVCELAEADSAFVAVLHDGRAVVRAAAGDPAIAVDSVVDVATPAIAQALRTRTTVTTPAGRDWADRERPGRSTIVPLPATSVSGVLVVSRPRGCATWTPEESTHINSMANLATLALEFAVQQRRRRLLDLLADRDRIAQDLHDNVIQRLFAAGMSLQSTITGDTDEERREAVIRTTIEQLDRTVREIRTTIFDLHTTGAAASTSLRRRLLDVVADLTTHSTVTPVVQFSGPIDTLVPDRIRAHAEAVLREALSNALRHSQAAHIWVSVSADDHLTVTVRDDGIGYPAEMERSGLANLARRAEQCDGTAVTRSLAEGGAQVQWSVPLDDPSPVAASDRD